MNDPISKVLAAIGPDAQLKKLRDDEWECKCPAHDDSTPSLGVAFNRSTGKVLITCRGGCATTDVVAALGLKMRDLFTDNGDGAPRVKIRRRVTGRRAWEIKNTHGETVVRHVRLDYDDGEKSFVWEHPDGTKGLQGRKVKTLPLYGSERLREAPAGALLFVCEGEGCADALGEAGHLGVGTVTGANSIHEDSQLEALRGFDVVLWADNDSGGREHMASIAKRLAALGIKHRFVMWPEAPEKGDAVDFLKDRGADAVMGLVPDEEAEQPQQSDDRKSTHSAELIKIARRDELFHTADGTCYATIRTGQRNETVLINSVRYRERLALVYFREQQAAATTQAMNEALNIINAYARHDGTCRTVYRRVGAHDGALYLDLGDPEWRAVRITDEGWRVVSDPPVRFVRSDFASALPVPIKGGGISRLWDFLNVHEAGRPLVLAFMVSALRPTGPYPILGILGQQGSAKTCTTKFILDMLDPSTGKLGLLTPPDKPIDAVRSASTRWVSAYENVSKISDAMSDTLCRLSTGGGLAIRRLFTTSDEVSFDLTRAVMLNGIGSVFERSDLLDRAIVLTLEPVKVRLEQAEMEREFEAERPRLLGALLDAVVTGLRNLPDTVIKNPPRLADFARWATACEPAFDCDVSFHDAYQGNHEDRHWAAIEASSVALPVIDFAKTHGPAWEGTATELLRLLSSTAPSHMTKRPDWPKAANRLSSELNRAAPSLHFLGVVVQTGLRDNGGQRTRKVRVTYKGDRDDAPVGDSAERPSLRNAREQRKNSAHPGGGTGRDNVSPLASLSGEHREDFS